MTALNLKSYPFQKIAIVNLCLISILYFDLFIPIETRIPEKFLSFESYKKIGRSYRGSEYYEYVYRLECQSGNTYRFIFKPTFNATRPNEKIVIKKTFFLSRVKEVQIGNEVYDVSFLCNTTILICAVFSLAVALSYFFLRSPLIEMVLGFTTPFLYIGSIIYLLTG